MKCYAIEIVDAVPAYSERSGTNDLRLPGYNVTDKAGNAKWMSKDEFEKKYHPLDA